ncbi:zinc finger domain-containing protein [Mycobacterium sp. NPDC003449]
MGCPRCGVPRGTWCKTYLLHPVRVEAARRLLNPARTTRDSNGRDTS